MLVRCVPAKRVGRVIVASWARLTTFLGVPPRGFERSDGWLSPASLLRSLPMRTFDLVWVTAAAAAAAAAAGAAAAAEVVTEAAATAAAGEEEEAVSGEKEAEERADEAAVAAEVAARVVRAALAAVVAVEGAETEGPAGPLPKGGPLGTLAPSPVCEEEVVPPGGAVLSSWAALETVEGYSHPLPLAFTLALTLTPSLTPTLAPTSSLPPSLDPCPNPKHVLALTLSRLRALEMRRDGGRCSDSSI